MSIYAIGDIQGKLDALKKLLNKIQFNSNKDQLWFTGDLANRGPAPLETIRFIRSLGESAKPVMGNHDLHMLAVAAGVRKLKNRDTFREIFSAPDKEDILFWLRQLPFYRIDKVRKLIMLHAGIYRQWTIVEAINHAENLEGILRGSNYINFLKKLHKNKSTTWSNDLEKEFNYHFITNVFTRMRFCTASGDLDMKHKGRPGSQPANLSPWFSKPNPDWQGWRIIFGHWATLGYYHSPGIICIDSGCVWNNKLTAVQLDCIGEKKWQIEC